MHPTHRHSLARFVESNGCTQAKEFELLHKNYAAAVAMATMTFQDGSRSDIGDPTFYLKK
jgi:hypothetical protein